MNSALQAVLTRWRADAETLRRYSSLTEADILARCARDLEDAVRAMDDELLTPQEAMLYSGYSLRRIRELTAAGQLANHGTRHRPRYRRADLPLRTRHVDAAAQEAAERFRHGRKAG